MPTHTAYPAVEVMLRENARAYSNPATPRGCFIVLSATNYTPNSARIRDLLVDLRNQDRRLLLERLIRAVADKELPETVDTAALSAFVMTVLHGLSIQARDGADARALDSAVDMAILAWDRAIEQAVSRLQQSR